MRCRLVLLTLPLGLAPVVLGQEGDPDVLRSTETDVATGSATMTLWALGALIAAALLVALLTTPRMRRRFRKWRMRTHERAHAHRSRQSDPNYEYFRGPKYLHRRHTGTGTVEMLVEKHWVPERRPRHGHAPPAAEAP